MLGVGDRIPDAQVWLAPGEQPVQLASLLKPGPCLFLFYLYDWSST
jgi:hypothetical protein